MSRFKKLMALALLGVSALLLSPPGASAGFMNFFTGNVVMRDIPARSGVVSFTVYQTTGPGWAAQLTAAFGTSAPVYLFPGAGVANANYVYLYEVVNVSTSSGQLDGFKVSNPGAYTSAGYFLNQVFKDSAFYEPVASNQPVEGRGGNNNYALGTNPQIIDDAGFRNQLPPPTDGGVATLTGADATNTIAPDSTDLGVGGDGAGFVTFGFPGHIGHLQWTSIIFLTSDIAPVYAPGRVTDGNFSDGDIPAATPEPGTLMLTTIGFVGVAGSLGWRRWRARLIARLA